MSGRTFSGCFVISEVSRALSSAEAVRTGALVSSSAVWHVSSTPFLTSVDCISGTFIVELCLSSAGILADLALM